MGGAGPLALPARPVAALSLLTHWNCFLWALSSPNSLPRLVSVIYGDTTTAKS